MSGWHGFPTRERGTPRGSTRTRVEMSSGASTGALLFQNHSTRNDCAVAADSGRRTALRREYTPHGLQTRATLSLLRREKLLRLADQVEAAGDADEVFLRHGAVGDRQRVFEGGGDLGHLAVLLDVL